MHTCREYQNSDRDFSRVIQPAQMYLRGDILCDSRPRN